MPKRLKDGGFIPEVHEGGRERYVMPLSLGRENLAARLHSLRSHLYWVLSYELDEEKQLYSKRQLTEIGEGMADAAVIRHLQKEAEDSGLLALVDPLIVRNNPLEMPVDAAALLKERLEELRRVLLGFVESNATLLSDPGDWVAKVHPEIRGRVGEGCRHECKDFANFVVGTSIRLRAPDEKEGIIEAPLFERKGMLEILTNVIDDIDMGITMATRPRTMARTIETKKRNAPSEEEKAEMAEARDGIRTEGARAAITKISKTIAAKLYDREAGKVLDIKINAHTTLSATARNRFDRVRKAANDLLDRIPPDDANNQAREPLERFVEAVNAMMKDQPRLRGV